MTEAVTSQQSKRDKLQDWLSFVISESHILKVYPELIWQQATYQPERSDVSRRAEKLQAAGCWTRRLSPCLTAEDF